MKLTVKVKPNAKKPRLVQEADGSWTAYLQSPPVDGKANRELIQVLAKQFGVPKSAVSISIGAGSRQKVVAIDLDP